MKARGPTPFSRGWGAPPLGRAPTSWAPWSSSLARIFYYFSKMFRGVSGHSENICFLHIKQHHGNSAENSVNPG